MTGAFTPGPKSPRSPLPLGAQHDGWAVGRGAFIEVTNPDYGGYSAGYVTTPHGVVGFYAQSGCGPRFLAHTSFDFVHSGRAHRVTWERAFSDRFIRTLAKRFAAEVAARATGPASPLGDSGKASK